MMEKSEDLSKLIEFIKSKNDFVLATHVQPDGDAIGSLLGLGMILKNMGKKVFLSWGEQIAIPRQYSFLPGIKLIKEPSQCPSDIDVFIALDCATLDRLGALASKAERAKMLANIDHHAEKSRFGQINITDECVSSTAELILGISNELGVRLTKDIATCLYVGVVTDTGKFQYTNTTQDTFDAAKELLKYGISPNKIFQSLYETTSFNYLKLQGIALSRATLVKDIGMIYTWILQSDLEKTDAKLSQTENLIDLLRSVEGIKVAVVIKELDDSRLNVSLRSRGKINVSRLAENFGGGGHANAAGFKSSDTREKVIDDLVKALKK